eukprot:2157261-Pyramimonas_sp.AAC.1
MSDRGKADYVRWGKRTHWRIWVEENNTDQFYRAPSPLLLQRFLPRTRGKDEGQKLDMECVPPPDIWAEAAVRR